MSRATVKKPATPAKKPVQKKRTATPAKAVKPVTRRPRAVVAAVPEKPVHVPEAVPENPVPETAAPAPTGNLSGDALAHLQTLGDEAAQDSQPEAGEQPTPEEAAQAEQERLQAEMAATMGATLIVGGAEGAAIRFYHPAASFPPAMKAGVIQDLAAVLAKYTGAGGVMPEWFVKFVLPFIEELKLTAKIGTLVYAVVTNVNKAKAEEAERERQRQEQQQRGGQQGQSVDFATQGA